MRRHIATMPRELDRSIVVLPAPAASGDDILDLVDELTATVGRPPVERTRPGRRAYEWRTEAGTPIVLSPA